MNSPRIVFMGTPEFAVSTLQTLCESGYSVVRVVTVPDRQTGRGLKLTFSPVNQYAIEHQLPVLQPEQLRTPEFIAALRALNADIFVVVAFRMLPQEVWSMPHLGTFNLHASLLPQYRGAAPINWAIINGEKETGVTTFLLNERIDEGSILLQKRTHINENDNAETLHDRLAEMGAQLVIKTVNKILDGTIKGQPQEISDKLNSAPKIFKETCKINWNMTCCEIHNFVRGLSPYPTAWSEFISP